MAKTYLESYLSFLSLQSLQSPGGLENVFESDSEDASPKSDASSTETKNKQATFSGFSITQNEVPAFLEEVDTTNTGNLHDQNNISNAKPVDRDACISNKRSKKEINNYQCTTCHNRFKRIYDLKTHMRTHTGEKPFECEQCKKKFTQKQHLKMHIRTHTGKKPFKCEQCNKEFYLKGNLKKHISSHTGEKPLKCKQCNKKFNRKGSLKTHMQTHTGEMLFECEQCDKKFSWKCNMTKHMRTHTARWPKVVLKAIKVSIS